jgi:hypothetical protein
MYIKHKKKAVYVNSLIKHFNETEQSWPTLQHDASFNVSDERQQKADRAVRKGNKETPAM